MLADYEKMGGWIVQRKYNGQRNLIHINTDKSVNLLGGAGKPHANYVLPESVKKQILSLNIEEGKEYWIDSELMHNKTGDLKNVIILFDILYAGQYLFGMDQMSRLEILKVLCGVLDNTPLDERKMAYMVRPNIWLAPFFDTNFPEHFAEIISLDEIEGLVLRRKDGRLDNLGQKEYEASWVIRCRKEHKNYDF
jgi:ATP-dependent DNA ligase